MRSRRPGNGAYLDTSVLRFAGDLRGIHQVVFRMAEILAADPRFAGTRFVAAEGTYAEYLEPLGVRREDVVEMPALPLIGRFERFHGLGGTFRYRRILAEKPRLILHPELRTILRARVPQGVCYHDFIELEDGSPGRKKWTRRAYYRYKAGLAARAAYKMANSAHTRDRALEFFPSMDPESIAVVHLGVRRALAEGGGVRPPDLRPLACLYVGSYEPRKNIPAMLERFREIVGEREAVLHLAGRVASEVRRDLEARSETLGISSRIRWHGLVTDEVLAGLYATSHILLFPSLKEGFGLPLAEAMAHGLPVFAFRNTCIPEIVGQGGILAANGDFGAWGRALDALSADPREYQALSRKARERARYFAPEAARDRLAAWLAGIFHAAGIPDGKPGDP